MNDDAGATRELGSPDALREPLLQVHHATQLLAAAGQALAEERPDDSHRSMTWSDELGGFVGEPLVGVASGGWGRTRMSLRVADLTAVVVGPDARNELALVGRTLDDAYAWMWGVLEERVGSPVTPVRPEFEIPTHPVADGAEFRVADARLREIASLYGDAAARLMGVRASRGGSEVRCWPHHFDIATLITAREAVGDDSARTVGVGLAPMGGGYDEWYWYVSPWPWPDAAGLPPLDGPGHWHTDGWVGAVLEGRHVVAAGSAAAQRRLVDHWLDRAVDAAQRALG